MKSKKIKNIGEIVEILEKCRVMRLGLADGYFPYIVPVNFVYRISGGDIEIFFHGGMYGKKYELLKKNPYCSFEMDIDYGVYPDIEKKIVTSRYASIMGKAQVEFLEGEMKNWRVVSSLTLDSLA